MHIQSVITGFAVVAELSRISFVEPSSGTGSLEQGWFLLVSKDRGLEGDSWSSRFCSSSWLSVRLGVFWIWSWSAWAMHLCNSSFYMQVEGRKWRGFGIASMWTYIKHANLHLCTSVVWTCWTSVRIRASFPMLCIVFALWMDIFCCLKHVFIRGIV